MPTGVAAPGRMLVGGTSLQFAVGFRSQTKTDHVVVEAEDALVAALRVKAERPEALITYVRRQNRRGDMRHVPKQLDRRGDA